MHLAVGPDMHGGARDEGAPDPLDREPTPVAARAAGVGDQAVALDHDRPVALGQLDRDVGHAGAGVREAVVAVGDRPAAPGADDELAVDERLVLDPAGEERERAAALPAAGTRCGISCASAPFITSERR